MKLQEYNIQNLIGKIKLSFKLIYGQCSNFFLKNIYGIILLLILCLNIFLSISWAKFGLPYLHHWDEPAMMTPVLNILKTGEFNRFNLPQGFSLYGGIIQWILLLSSFIHYMGLAAIGALQSASDIQVHTGISTEFQVYTGYSWLISHPSFYLVGRKIICLLGSTSVFVLYKIASNVYNKKTALIAAFIMGTLPVFIYYSYLLVPYVPTTLAVLISILFILKYNDEPTWEYLIYIGLSIGCASSMRINLILLIIPVLIVIIFSTSQYKFYRTSLLVLISVLVEIILNFQQLISFEIFVKQMGFFIYYSAIKGHLGGEGVPGFPQIFFYFNVFLKWFNLKILGIPSYYYALAAIPTFFKKDEIKKNIILYGSFIVLFYPFINIKYNFPRSVLFLTPFIVLLIANGLYNSGKFLLFSANYIGSKTRVSKHRKMIIFLNGILIVLMIYLFVQPIQLINRVNLAYSYMTTYKETRTRAMFWLANQVKPSDKIVIAKKLRIHKYDQRLIKLKQIYDFVKSEKFKRLKQNDLIKFTDDYILKKLQHSPNFVYEKPDLVLIFLKTNKFKIASPKIIIRKDKKITKKWIADNFINYVVGYDEMVDDFNPFLDPPVRKSLKKFPLSHIKPIKSFGKRPLQKKLFSVEPKVNIYEFNSQLIRFNLNNCEVASKKAKTRNIISLNNNGYVKTPSIKLESGTYSVSLYAKGTKVNGIGPRIKVELYDDKGNNKVQVDELEITSVDYQRYQTKTFQTSRGEKRIKISFYNDKYDQKSKQDRSFYLKELLITPRFEKENL